MRTDHYSLKFLLDQRLATIPQHQWASKLLGFDFKVEFKPGAQNVVADALSRRDADEDGELAAFLPQLSSCLLTFVRQLWPMLPWSLPALRLTRLEMGGHGVMDSCSATVVSTCRRRSTSQKG